MTRTGPTTASRTLGPDFTHIVHPDGTAEWFDTQGWLHRPDGPAVTNGRHQSWWWHGLRHRDDGPAILTADGDQEWWQHGHRHRLDGPAVIFGEYPDGYWFVHGHRLHDDGPLEALAVTDPETLRVALSLYTPETDVRALIDAVRAARHLPTAS